MGVVANAALAEGGRVVGVIPDRLATQELAHHGLTELHIVSSMHERKAMMARLSAGFLTLPGGIGTFEEFFEILTWGALGLHHKPVGLLNVEGYFDPLLSVFEHGVREGFIRPRHRDLLRVSEHPETLAADLFRTLPPDPGPLWIDPDPS
jgi:uncharacterized protein (TIGR00730 family)